MKYLIALLLLLAVSASTAYADDGGSYARPPADPSIYEDATWGPGPLSVKVTIRRAG
jgi:hypothetical protein